MSQTAGSGAQSVTVRFQAPCDELYPVVGLHHSDAYVVRRMIPVQVAWAHEHACCLGECPSEDECSRRVSGSAGLLGSPRRNGHPQVEGTVWKRSSDPGILENTGKSFEAPGVDPPLDLDVLVVVESDSCSVLHGTGNHETGVPSYFRQITAKAGVVC